MKEYLESKKNYKCYYNFVRGEKLFFFLNGLAGIKNFFYSFKKYKKKTNGLLLVDFPGFGKSKYFKVPKNIIRDHLRILKIILKKNKINEINLVAFSLSTAYLEKMNKDKFFTKRIKKIFFLDPSLKKKDLDWSMTIFKKNKKQYKKYIYMYKKNLRRIFPLGLYNKNSQIDKITKQMKYFDEEVLFKLNRESVDIILKNKLKNVFKRVKKFYLLPQNKKKIKKTKVKKFFINKSKHYIFLDNPKSTYSILSKNG